MTTHLRRSILAATATLTLVLSVPAAHAGTFTISSCTSAQPSAARWVSVRNAVWLLTSESCRPLANGFVSGMWAYPTYGQGGGPAASSASWRFAVGAPLAIR